MKKSITAIIAAAGILSFGATAQVEPSDDSVPSQICAAAANDQASKLRRLLKQEHKNIRIAAKNITCDGKPLKQFSQESGAIKVSQKIYGENVVYVAQNTGY